MRLVCHNFASTTAPHAFEDISITFKASSFKASRSLSLKRVGRHVKRLTFNVPHSADSFLPPICDQYTGEQLTFNYKPQVESPGNNKEPKYGTWEMTDLLIRQYPPLFHAATNIPAFIRAFSALPNIEHMTIFSPDQNMSPRYRRSISDYTLISLRIAIERAPLHYLSSLSLKAIHPAALLSLQPVLSYGSTPNSCRRWTQVRNLSISMDSSPFSCPKSDDHVRVIQAYLRAFSTSITHLSFCWTGRERGPSPLSSDIGLLRWCGDSPLRQSPREENQRRPTSPKPLRFFNLKYLLLEHATMDSEQVAEFITNHRETLMEFNFEDVSLQNGDWESTLHPLKRLRRNERSKPRLKVVGSPRGVFEYPEEMDVPCKLSPIEVFPDDPIIEGTLEPQDEYPAPWIGSGKTFGMKRWFDRGNRAILPAIPLVPAKRKHERTVSDHLRRVLHGKLFNWR